jgi:transcriptional regulator with XRE-family HTH domain
MNLSEILTALMEKHQLSDNQLADAVGMNQSTITRLRNGLSKDPRNSTTQPIAHYFGLTLAQLRGEQSIPGLCEKALDVSILTTLTPDEIELIQRGRELSPKHLAIVRELVATYSVLDQREQP